MQYFLSPFQLTDWVNEHCYLVAILQNKNSQIFPYFRLCPFLISFVIIIAQIYIETVSILFLSSTQFFLSCKSIIQEWLLKNFFQLLTFNLQVDAKYQMLYNMLLLKLSLVRPISILLLSYVPIFRVSFPRRQNNYS